MKAAMSSRVREILANPKTRKESGWAFVSGANQRSGNSRTSTIKTKEGTFRVVPAGRVIKP
ncbi:MAG: hypothetical protein V3R64_07990 [Sphingomonadales bacterium]